MASTDFAALQVRLDLAASEFQKGMSQATKSLGKMQRQTQDMNRRMRDMQRQVSGVTKGLIALAGVGVGGAMLKNIVSMADGIAKAADATGFATEKFQELQYAAELSGVNISQFNSNMTAFVKRIGEARVGMGPLASGLKNYDAALLESLKNTRSQEEALNVLSDAMKNARDSQEQALIANAAFGRSGINMVNMLRDGSGALKEMGDEARAMGIIMEDKLVRAAVRYQDQLTRLQRTIQMTFGIQFLETVTSVMDNARGVMLAFIGATAKGFEGLRKGVKITFTNLKTAALSALEVIIAPLRKLLEMTGKVVPAFGQLAKDLPTIGDAMKDNADAVRAIFTDESAELLESALSGTAAHVESLVRAWRLTSSTLR